MTDHAVISRWSAVSPFGIGGDVLSAGLRERRGCAVTLDHDRWPVPFEAACLVPGFDARQVLGAKGTRSMDRLTALAASATAELLRGNDDGRIDGVGVDAAVVLGTAGSAQSIMDFTRDSLVKERPYFVNPAHFPNTVMNCAAAQCGIRHQLQGPNVTVAGGRSSALLALNYARRLLRAGRAEAVLCGAAEEFSVARAWLEHRAARNRQPDAARQNMLGEGCAMLLIEPSGRASRHRRGELAEVLALELRVYDTQSDLRAVLGDCLRRVLAAGNESPAGIWAVASAHDPELAGAEPDGVLAEILGCDPPVRLPMIELIGDTHSASAAFGLAAVLALAAQEPAAAGRTALVTSVDRDGTVGAALLRLVGATHEQPN